MKTMKTVRHLCPAGFLAVVMAASSSGAQAQSLADVARKEAERRKGVSQPSKVYTNDDVEKAAGPLTTGTSVKTSPPDATGQAAAGSTADATKSDAKPPTETSGPSAAGRGDEATWRNRITTARQALAKAEAFERALQSQINGLWADFTARDNPVERTKIEQDRASAMTEHDRVKAEVASLKTEIADIEEEARRAGVPPGWLR